MKLRAVAQASSPARWWQVALLCWIVSLVPAAAQDLQQLTADDKQWVMAPKNYANTRFSGLDQINTGNVGQLKLAWTFSVGADRGQEAAPFIIDGTLYIVAPYAGPHPNQVFARAQLFSLVWGQSAGSVRTVDNFVGQLRKRFEIDPEAPRHFITVRGSGYRFDP